MERTEETGIPVALPPEVAQWLHLQRTLKGQSDAERLQQIRDDVDVLDRFFNLRPKRLLDFGCGLGIASVIMSRRWPDAELFSVDGSGPPVARGGMMPKSEVPWNDLNLTKSVVAMNPGRITVYDLSETNRLPTDIDTVVSMCASGWHWPLANDLPLFERVGARKIVCDMRRQGLVVPLGWKMEKYNVWNHKRVRVLLEKT